jgi:oxidase EvaA
MIVESLEDVPHDDDFRWLTLGQIKQLAGYDNVVNMDLRTVISGVQFNRCSAAALQSETTGRAGSFAEQLRRSCSESSGTELSSLDDILSWIAELKATNDLFVERVRLQDLGEWTLGEDGISHREGRFFSVRWVQVEIENREVARWHQPIVAPHEQGLIAFLVRKVNGTYHFLVQAKLECGNFDLFELAPTVQCFTSSYRNPLDEVPFLRDVLGADAAQIRYDVLQSEEGGRFYHEQNRNLLVEVGDEFPLEVPANFRWMTLAQLLHLARFNNFVNIQTRGLLAAIEFS